MTRISLSYLLGAVLLAGSIVACGGDGDAENGGEGGSLGAGGTGGTGGSQHDGALRDTSDYEGRLIWSKAVRLGVYAWDLPGSELIFEREAVIDEAKMFSEPSISADGTTMAYEVEQDFFLSAHESVVEIVDLETGEVIPYTNQGLGDAEIRFTSHPSLSADGRRIAVAESSAQLVERAGGEVAENETPDSIEVWDLDTDTRIRVTDGAATDTKPFLSEDGERVLFLSSRDEASYDFYLANVEENAQVQRVSFRANPTITTPARLAEPGFVSVSADLRWVLFMGSTEDGVAFFLMDTEEGEVEILDIQPEDVELSSEAFLMLLGVAISADGSQLGFIVHYLDGADPLEPKRGTQVLTSPRENPSEVTKIFDLEYTTPRAVALSRDGTAIAFPHQGEGLWISGVNGSNRRLVSSDDEDRLGFDLTGQMTLMFSE